jgi:hypothetical protein
MDSRGPKGVWRRNTAMIVFCVMVVGFSWISWLSRQETIHVNRESYQRCQDRTVNTAKQNAFYQAMAELEASNKFIDQQLRDERVALYRGLVLAPAHCGTRP